MNRPTRQKYLQRWNSLKTERSSFDAHAKELSEYFLPRSSRFTTSERNRGDKSRFNRILDNTGTKALRTLAAGMMSGMSSPARPWFRLATSDTELMEYAPVKWWLNEVTKQMRMVFSKSNTYRSLHQVYEELGLFGTGASIIVDDFTDVIRHQTLTFGEYAISTDPRREVSTLYREFDMTVAQIVREFGKENCSIAVQNLWNNGNLDAWVTVIHCVEPRFDRDFSKRDAGNMPFSSVYFEQGCDHDKLLRESGFEQFPAICPRWMVTGNDIYGGSPAMEALGDCKQLQHEQLRKAEAIDYQTKPPIILPTALKNQEVNLNPGGRVYADSPGSSGMSVRSAFEVNLNLQHLLMDIEDVRGRINGAFYADLFMMLANDTRSGITATEVAERHEEKLLMLGPVLERLHNEMLDPLVDNTFNKLMRSGLLPEPPQELQGIELKIEYISTLAQAQRAVGTASVDRLLGTIGAVAQMKPDVLDKIDADQLVDVYSDMLGVDPSLIVADDRVALIREDRAAVQQQQMAQQQAVVAAESAQKLGNTPMGQGDTALDSMLNLFQGYTTP
jgi:hypothetical protein